MVFPFKLPQRQNLRLGQSWNPADMDPDLALSGNNLVVTSTGTGSLRSVVSRIGSFQWDATFDIPLSGGNGAGVGVANALASLGGAGLGSYIGVDNNGCALYAPGQVYINGANVGSMAAIVAGNVIRTIVNRSRKTIAFKNLTTGAALTGIDISAITGPLFAAADFPSTGGKITAKFS